MRHRTPTTIALLVLIACFLAAPGGLQAQSENWKDIAKRFKKEFDPEDTPLKKREELLKEIRRSDDGRAVPLLLDAMDDQRDHVEDILKAWQEGMQEWQEKTSRLEKQREERVRRIVERAKKQGKEPSLSVDLNSEEGRWLGAPPKHVGEMVATRDRLMKK